MNKVALITGGSKGIGFEMAKELAKRGYNLVLISRSEAELNNACKTLSEDWKVTAQPLVIDLSEDEAPDKIFDFVQKNNLQVSILINNAGYGLWGSFEELTLEDQQKMLMVNSINLVKLTHLLLPILRKQTRSYILNVSSTTAYQAIANFNLYSASKVFVIYFSRALRRELEKSNISVSVLSPGTVSTNFMNRAGMHTQTMLKNASKVTMEASVVAAFAIDGMFKGKNEMIPGFINWISVKLTKFLPKSLPEKIAAGLYKK